MTHSADTTASRESMNATYCSISKCSHPGVIYLVGLLGCLLSGQSARRSLRGNRHRGLVLSSKEITPYLVTHHTISMLVLGLVDIPIWLLLIVGIIVLALWYSSLKHGHFKKLGIPGPKPWPFMGNMLDFFLKDLWTLDTDYKKKYGNVVGVYGGFKPSVIVYEQEMLSQVMVKQFDHFTNRMVAFDTGDPVFSNMLTVIKDDHWKHVRSNLSPTFTTGKLRQMTGEINRCAKQLAENITSNAGPFEVREACGDYTMDVIASTGFGLRVDSQSSKDNPFVVNGKKIMNLSFRNPLFIIMLVIPSSAKFLKKYFGYTLFDKAAMTFFVDVIKQTLDSRKQGDKSRSDFIQLMSNAKQGEETHDMADEDEVEKLNKDTTRTGLTENEILANALIFFLAGFDTTMTGLTYIIYCLARNPECQQKLIEEIDSIVGDKEEVTYDDVMKMTYLEQCMQESMRIYSPAPRLDRECKEDIDINGISFKKGNLAIIPVHAIHHDPEIWPDPEKFDPERFSTEEKAKRNPILWLPFGYGPRNCVGMRLATYELKVAVVHILRTHKLATCEKTEYPIVWEKGKWLRAKNGIWLITEKRK